MVIPCLYSFLFTALRSPFAESPVNKKVPKPFFRKESGSYNLCRHSYGPRNREGTAAVTCCRPVRVAFADFSTAPWWGLEKSERGPSLASLCSPFCRYATSSPGRGKSFAAGRRVAAPSIRCALLAYRWPRPQQLLAASAAGGARRRCSRLRCCSSP